MKILVTGGADFIGSYIAEHFSPEEYTENIFVINGVCLCQQ